MLLLLWHKNYNPLRVHERYAQTSENTFIFQGVFNKYVTKLFEHLDTIEGRLPVISVLALDKEFVRDCESHELEALLATDKDGLSIVVAMTKEANMGTVFDFGYCDDALANYMTSTIGLTSSLQVKKKDVGVERWMEGQILHVEFADERTRHVNGMYEIEKVQPRGTGTLSDKFESIFDSMTERLSPTLSPGSQRRVQCDALRLGRKLKVEAQSKRIQYDKRGIPWKPLFERGHDGKEKTFGELLDECSRGQDMESLGKLAERRDPFKCRCWVGTHTKERIFKQLILNVREMNEWSDEFAPILTKNMQTFDKKYFRRESCREWNTVVPGAEKKKRGKGKGGSARKMKSRAANLEDPLLRALRQ